MPVFLSELPELIRSRRIRIDVALLQVSPPDRHGYASLGVSVDIVRAAVDAADLVIAEVNPRMPRTLGDSFVAVERIDHLVAVDRPLLELTPEPPDGVCAEIGHHVASLIPDGATIQTGIGRIPHAVCQALLTRRDLGVHTEMLSDSVIDLVEAGAITGKAKTLLPGKIVTSFVMGTRRLYDWVDDNPAVELRPSEFTNDPFVIARNDNMVAINSALAIDLTGQVAADTLMGRFFSGIGGQVDFVRGAARSRGGKPIIALPSTAKDGTLSRIRPVLEEGAGVVTSRGDVRYVVTEYGVADLWGKSIRQRALSLSKSPTLTSAPSSLLQAKARRYVFPNQLVPRAAYAWEEECVTDIRGGEQISDPAHAHERRGAASRLALSAVRREHLPALLPVQEGAPRRGDSTAGRPRLRAQHGVGRLPARRRGRRHRRHGAVRRRSRDTARGPGLRRARRMAREGDRHGADEARGGDREGSWFARVYGGRPADERAHARSVSPLRASGAQRARCGGVSRDPALSRAGTVCDPGAAGTLSGAPRRPSGADRDRRRRVSGERLVGVVDQLAHVDRVVHAAAAAAREDAVVVERARLVRGQAGCVRAGRGLRRTADRRAPPRVSASYGAASLRVSQPALFSATRSS